MAAFQVIVYRQGFALAGCRVDFLASNTPYPMGMYTDVATTVLYDTSLTTKTDGTTNPCYLKAGLVYDIKIYDPITNELLYYIANVSNQTYQFNDNNMVTTLSDGIMCNANGIVTSRSIVAGAGITVTNGTGAAGNIIIDATAGVSSVSGTTDRITVSPTTGATIVDISPNYVGQTSIITLGTISTGTWAGTNIALNKGGTNAALAASNGGIFYSTATAGAILSGTATAGQILRSGSSAAPSWSTATYPATTTINQLLYSSSGNVVAGLATGNNAILVTSSGGVPSLSGTLPFTVPVTTGGTGLTTATTAYGIVCAGTTATGTFQVLSTLGTANQVLVSQGAASLPTWSSGTFTGSSSGTNTGDQTITLTSDVTGSGTGSFATTIANNAVTTAKIINSAVTLAKIANAAANSKILGSGASGIGAAYVEITLGSGLTMTGTTLSASGAGIADGTYGDIVVSSSGTVWTVGNNAITTAKINNSAVTLAKIANAAANSRLVGSGSAGTGAAYTELSLGTGLAMSASSLAVSGILVGVQILTNTAGGTYTPTAGANTFIAYAIAGGAAGGRATQTAATGGIGGGGGGGAWGWFKFSLSDIGASKPYTIGAGGTTVSGATGNNGGTTTLGTAGSLINLNTAATGGTVANSQSTATGHVTAGGTGGIPTATGFELVMGNGENGGAGIHNGTFFCISGKGGATGLGLGLGGGETAVASGATIGGNPGRGYGSGGSGNAALSNATSTDAGAGTQGVIIIFEYA